jgi:hypothetical protein
MRTYIACSLSVDFCNVRTSLYYNYILFWCKENQRNFIHKIFVRYYSRLFKNTFTNPGKASFSSTVPTGLVCFMRFRTAYTADIRKTNRLLCASTAIQFVFRISPANSNFSSQNLQNFLLVFIYNL